MFLSSRKASKELDLHPNTLRKMENDGEIRHIKTKSGQRRYDVESYIGYVKEQKLICYCRVSSYKQKDDLQRQIEFMQEKYPEAKIVKDIGSGLNFKRKGLISILEQSMCGDITTLVVAHRDRLARFGFELIKYIIERNGGKLLVLNQSSMSPEEELTKDLLNILHVFSCRMHGLRNYKNKISKDITDKKSKENV